jgi:uncharacterized membrane protein
MRIIYKSITWRISMLVSSYFTGLFLGLSSKKAIGLTIALNIINTVIYYIHEKIWSKKDVSI